MDARHHWTFRHQTNVRTSLFARIQRLCEDFRYVKCQVKALKNRDNTAKFLRGYYIFDESIGFQYCDEIFGSRSLIGIRKEGRLPLRAIRMLISYQKEGDFEFRTPSVQIKESE